MRGEKKIRAALPHLTERELWFVEFDAHRAADVAAIGGASVTKWRQYVSLEEDAAKERKRRFPGSVCPFPNARADRWTKAELEEMGKMYERIYSGKTNKSEATA